VKDYQYLQPSTMAAINWAHALVVCALTLMALVACGAL